MGNASGSAFGTRPTDYPRAPQWVGIGIAVALAGVTAWAWDRVQLWTQIVLIALTGVAVIALLTTAVFRRGIRGIRGGGEKPGAAQGRAARLFLYAAVALGVISTFFVGTILILKVGDIPLPEQFILPMLLIGGAVAMLLTIAIVAVVFSDFKLSDSRAALALPEGSVRAVIALLLILIFAIMAVFLYATLLKGNERTSKRITQAQIDVLPKDEIVSIKAAGVGATGEPVFDVVLSVPANSAAQDFAKQLLTTVSTLVVAISAFYFGARTAGRAGGERETPTLRIKDPQPPVVASAGEKVRISLDVSPKGAAVKGEVLRGEGEGPLGEGDPLQVKQVKPDDYTEWEWTAPDPMVRTVIMFSLAAYPDVAQKLEISPREEEPPGLGVDLAEDEEGEQLEPDESPEKTAEAGLTEAGVQPDEDVEFEDEDGGVEP